MSFNLRLDTFELVGKTRPYVNIPTSMILTIKKNVTRLLNSDVQGDPMIVATIQAVWRAELHDAEMELIQRN